MVAVFLHRDFCRGNCMVCVWLGKSATCHVVQKMGQCMGQVKNGALFFFEGFMFTWFYVYIYKYVLACWAKQLGEDSSKIQCRNKLLSNKIVIVESFFCGSNVFKENNGIFFQFVVAELLLDFFWSNLSVFSLKGKGKVSNDKTREKTWKDHHSAPLSPKFHFGAQHRWNPIWTPSPNPSWGPQLTSTFNLSVQNGGFPPPRLLETGFLAIFLCSPFHLSSAPSLPVLYLFRWLCFRSVEETGKSRNAATERNGGNRGAMMRFGRRAFSRYVHSLTVRPLKIGISQKESTLGNHPFSGFYVSFREDIFFDSFTTSLVSNLGLHHWQHIPCWVSSRISTGAGLIKVRGSSCWTDRTCLWYHFETQPILGKCWCVDWCLKRFFCLNKNEGVRKPK